MARTEADAMESEIVGNAGMGSDASALVARGATLMRVENDAMLAVAIQRPRDEKKVLKGAIEELHMVPEEAKRAYYSIPYKERQPDGSMKLVPVEGPSIKAAMALARRWGNCSVTARTLSEDAVGADLAGIFLDFETNFRVERPFRATRLMKKRNGGTWTLNPQQWIAHLQATASKASRTATLNGLPAYLVAQYLKHARIIAAGDPDSKADPKKVAAVLRGFERYKVTQDMLEKYVDAPIAEWMGDHLATLIGLGNAIADKQLTVEEAFDLPEADGSTSTPAGPASATNGITADAVANGTATATNNTPPTQAAQPNVEPPPCTHPAVPAARLAGVPKTKSVVCTDCMAEIPGTLALPEREPGDDVEEGPAEAPKATKPRQTRLTE